MKLKNSFYHYTMKNLAEHIDKMNLYTDLSAFHAEESDLRLLLRPFARLFRYIFIKHSYKDGVVGIVSALNAFFYEFVCLFKTWESRYIKKSWFEFYGAADINKEIREQETTHKEFIDAITASNPNLLLEVGTGAAAISFSIIKNKNIPIVIIDNNFDILKKIKSDAEKLNLKVIPVCADAFKLPFKDKTFAIVFSQGLLEHFSDPDIEIILNEKLRVALDSVLFSVPNAYYKHKDFGDERLLFKQEWESIISRFNMLESKNYYCMRTKKNFLIKRPLMYMARLKR
jgi:ubiquinone/menaquinone biosynthesis C-methylase UbiE